MELINATRMELGYNMAIEPSARELLVVVAKATFNMPRELHQRLRLREEQMPLVMADMFTGEPGYSAPRYEVDFAPRKHKVDILLNGSAYAPDGRTLERVPVSLSVGNMQKSFNVVGNRRWQHGLTGVRASEPEPFTIMPISYDRAFGGVDNKHSDTAQHAAFMHNPVGRGFHKHLKKEWIDGAPLPNTEELNRPITQPDGDYLPMSYGVIGRGWAQRSRYAGTYDDAWLEQYFPFLPPDFDEAYYQAAPLDQQLDGAVDGQQVILKNLTSDGLRIFKLPVFDAPVHIFPKKGGREDLTARMDTLMIEPDLERVTLTWRVCRPLKKNMFEIAQVVVGKPGSEWWQKREEVSFSLLDEEKKADCGCGKQGGCADK